MSRYGSSEWFEAAYRQTARDPWGLTWRPTQLFRYAVMASELHRCISERHLAVDSVVDVGCATGDFLNLLAESLPEAQQRRLIGVDLSSTAIDRARSRYPHLEFQTAGLDGLNQQLEGSVDLVCCLEVLYYLAAEDRPRAIATLRSILRPGGLLLVSSMTGAAPYMDYEQLCALVEKEFRIVTAAGLDLWPLVSLEKLALRTHLSPQFELNGFRPGRTGFEVMRRLARCCSALFGRRARSHAYVIAIRH
jgi:SAM-dependent methyltransferase